MYDELHAALEQVIEEKSRVLAPFSPPDAVSCGQQEIKEHLWAWCHNFDGLLHDYSILATLVKGIDIVEDKDILDSFYRAKKNILLPGRSVWYCPFGEPQGSSYRIMANLNKEANYNDSLRNLLDKIEREGKSPEEYPQIFFIDDFLNSGGQFKSILNSWTKTSSNKVDYSDSRIIDNLFLSPKQLKILKQCSLVFFFYICTENKRLELESELRKVFPKSRIIIEKTIPENGIFGTEEDVRKIKDKSDEYLSGKSIFSGKEGKEVFELLNVCREAGLQLLRANEPKWEETKIEERCLGYGNCPRLYIGQNNIPTFTMTSLWQSGPVTINGKTFYWQKFLPRRKKITKRTENPVEQIKTKIRLSERGTHTSVPLEIHIIGDLDTVSQDGIKTNPESCAFLNTYFSPKQVVDTLLLDLRSLEKVEYAKYNNHLNWVAADSNAEKSIDVKISRIQFLLYDAMTTCSIHLKINADNMLIDQIYPLLKQAYDINFKLDDRENAFLKMKEQRYIYKKFSMPELLNNIFRSVGLNTLQPQLFLMYFMRLDPDSEDATDLESNFELRQKLTFNSSEPLFINFQEAVAAVSNRVSAFISRSSGINDSGILQKEIADIYCFLEMLYRRCYNLLQVQKFTPQKLTERDVKILESDKLFLLNAHSDNPHVSQYMSSLRSRIKDLQF